MIVYVVLETHEDSAESPVIRGVYAEQGPAMRAVETAPWGPAGQGETDYEWETFDDEPSIVDSRGDFCWAIGAWEVQG